MSCLSWRVRGEEQFSKLNASKINCVLGIDLDPLATRSFAVGLNDDPSAVGNPNKLTFFGQVFVVKPFINSVAVSGF
jgi:hypothetical protein